MDRKRIGCLGSIQLFGTIALFVIYFFSFISSIMHFDLMRKGEWSNSFYTSDIQEYELKNASDALKYYTCPSCGTIVNRF
jgi:hypothetical protein